MANTRPGSYFVPSHALALLLYRRAQQVKPSIPASLPLGGVGGGAPSESAGGVPSPSGGA